MMKMASQTMMRSRALMMASQTMMKMASQIRMRILSQTMTKVRARHPRVVPSQAVTRRAPNQTMAWRQLRSVLALDRALPVERTNGRSRTPRPT